MGPPRGGAALFGGANAKNVGSYAGYIIGLHRHEPGITPAIILYSEGKLETGIDPQDGTGTALVPWDCKRVVIDGET